MKTLEELFIDELRDAYDAENRLTRALPAMAKAATRHELRRAFETQLLETEGQMRKLEKIFVAFGGRAKGRRCKAMVGLIREADELASDNRGEPTNDAALISAAQKVGHYEIATYGCLREWAYLLGNDEGVRLLQELLDEEKEADDKLTILARAHINEDAQISASGDGPETAYRSRYRP